MGSRTSEQRVVSHEAEPDSEGSDHTLELSRLALLLLHTNKVPDLSVPRLSQHKVGVTAAPQLSQHKLGLQQPRARGTAGRTKCINTGPHTVCLKCSELC